MGSFFFITGVKNFELGSSLFKMFKKLPVFYDPSPKKITPVLNFFGWWDPNAESFSSRKKHIKSSLRSRRKKKLDARVFFSALGSKKLRVFWCFYKKTRWGHTKKLVGKQGIFFGAGVKMGKKIRVVGWFFFWTGVKSLGGGVNFWELGSFWPQLPNFFSVRPQRRFDALLYETFKNFVFLGTPGPKKKP